MKRFIMLKQITVLILLTAFAAQTFNRAVIVVDYYANTAAYAKNCINKARPAMHCNGKCQMMKKIQEEEKKDQENAERKDAGKNNKLSCSYSFPTTLQSPPSTVLPVVIISRNRVGYCMDRSLDIFHPPRV